jgi:phenylacetic acid degradation operon negative regulatory protein
MTDLGIRPFNARSLVLSVLLGLPTPRLATRSLIRLAELFDLAPGTMRTALSRMVSAGELVVDDGAYMLSGRLLERKEAQDIGRRPPDDAWDGTWWVVVVTAATRTIASRREFRTHMVNARMGELRPDTWLRPANLPAPHVESDVVVVRGEPSGDEPSELVGRLWNLPVIAERCRMLRRELDAAAADVTSADVAAVPKTTMRAAAIVRFLREEPLLPRSLTPPDWPVDDLRDRYRRFDHEFGRVLRRAIDLHV